MANFTFKALDLAGVPTKGEMEAGDKQAVAAQLRSKGLIVVDIEELVPANAGDIMARFKRVKADELVIATRQLSTMVNSGMSLLRSLYIIEEQTENDKLREIFVDVRKDVEAGLALSDALRKHPEMFNDLYIAMVQAGETGGILDSTLVRVAEQLEKDAALRRQIKAAMIYPSMIAGMSVVTVTVLASFVLPRFKEFFASLNAELPLPTRMLLAVTDFLGAWWWALLAGLATTLVLLFAALRTEVGRHTRDRLVLRIPVVGPTVRFALVERFCRILSSMVGAGVSLPEALRVATDSLRSLVFIRALSRVAEALLEGEGLAGPLAATGVFPRTAAQMMRVGEETGSLDAQLEVAAHYYEGELDYKLKKVISLFEPAVIVVMGLLVGFVAVALVSAMYGIFNQVQV